MLYQKDGLDLDFVIERATLRIGILRSKLLNLQDHVIKDADDIDDWIWRAFSDSVAATTKVTGNKRIEKLVKDVQHASGEAPKEDHLLGKLFQQYLDLPEELAQMWHDATLEINTHWAPWRQPVALEGEVESDNELPSKESSLVASSSD